MGDADASLLLTAAKRCPAFMACFLFLSGPINREMRHLISTLQTHNQQMKGEVVKYKIRLRETQAELNQVADADAKDLVRSPLSSAGGEKKQCIHSLSLQIRASKGNAILQSQSSTEMDVKDETASPAPTVSGEPAVKTEPDNGSSTPSSTGDCCSLKITPVTNVVFFFFTSQNDVIMCKHAHIHI